MLEKRESFRGEGTGWRDKIFFLKVTDSGTNPKKAASPV